MHQNPTLQFPEHEHLNCPRCNSNNTKFCYYNNYNLLQPRHYCKNCRRYWTKGGTLRKVPIGGATRKPTKRSSTSNKRPADSPPQFKPESSAIFEFNNNNNNNNNDQSGGSFNSLLRSNQPAQIGGFVDGNLTNKTAEMDVLQVNYLSDGNHSGESNAPNLSIFTSGSNFR